MESVDTIQPKVSVVITCYNHGSFLAEAIRSVQRQTYQPIEIIVVDDGSTDNTSEVAKGFPEVNYIFQRNAGLSAARNTGVTASLGKYIVFLDADDWLYTEAIAINLNHLKRNKNCVFVSGGHDKVDAWGNVIGGDDARVIEKNHYLELLQGNYIGMHAAVMYHRIVFSEFRFDTTLKACEDYDLYLKIARKYPVCHHTHKVAAYRIHDDNMSKDYVLMLENVLKVLHRQEESMPRHERPYYLTGLKTWKGYYSSRLFASLWNRIGNQTSWPSTQEAKMLLTNKPKKLFDYAVKKVSTDLRNSFKRKLPDPILKALYEAGVYEQYIPPVGKINTGDLERLTPFSNDFGFDRGGAIDRYYIEEFVSANSGFIHGTVLEIGDNEYTLRYGKSLVQKSDILHVDASNSKATYVGDITNVPQIPSGYFDCIIFTQTLHLIYDFKSALQTCYRILKPGGCLLLTVPGITQVDKGAWKDYWLWSFTDTALKKVMTETFNGSEVEVETKGNVHVASAFLYGMGLPEVSTKALQYNDPAYQLIVTVRAIKH
jgi:glycosyltransferase involved in cell wall biosynthesis